jgi:hypothetical protein
MTTPAAGKHRTPDLLRSLLATIETAFSFPHPLSRIRSIHSLTFMEANPVEIPSAIYRWACTDGGKTARSLQLVSRSVGAIARGHRFRIIAVRGLHALQSAMDALALESIETSPIEHLFISDGPAHIECGANATEGCAAADDDAAFSKCVKDIFVYASCSLKSLTIVLQPPSICSTHTTKPHRHLVQISTSTPFPHLTSLMFCDPGN